MDTEKQDMTILMEIDTKAIHHRIFLYVINNNAALTMLPSRP